MMRLLALAPGRRRRIFFSGLNAYFREPSVLGIDKGRSYLKNSLVLHPLCRNFTSGTLVFPTRTITIRQTVSHSKNFERPCGRFFGGSFVLPLKNFLCDWMGRFVSSGLCRRYFGVLNGNFCLYWQPPIKNLEIPARPRWRQGLICGTVVALKLQGYFL